MAGNEFGLADDLLLPAVGTEELEELPADVLSEGFYCLVFWVVHGCARGIPLCRVVKIHRGRRSCPRRCIPVTFAGRFL